METVAKRHMLFYCHLAIDHVLGVHFRRDFHLAESRHAILFLQSLRCIYLGPGCLVQRHRRNSVTLLGDLRWRGSHRGVLFATVVAHVLLFFQYYCERGCGDGSLLVGLEFLQTEAYKSTYQPKSPRKNWNLLRDCYIDCLLDGYTLARIAPGSSRRADLHGQLWIRRNTVFGIVSRFGFTDDSLFVLRLLGGLQGEDGKIAAPEWTNESPSALLFPHCRDLFGLLCAYFYPIDD